MNLQDILDYLAYGELSQLALGNTDAEGIRVEDYPKIITHINLGLTEIHKRFDIRREMVYVQQYDAVSTYWLKEDFAMTSDSDEYYKYIKDSVENPFEGNVIKIERVFNEEGIEFPLNSDVARNSIHTPTPLSIQVSLPEAENSILVEYRANHPKIPIRNVNPMEVEVELPEAYLEALVYYVASRVFAPLNDPQAPGNESQAYMLRFEAACQKLIDLSITQVPNNTRVPFTGSGWV